MKKLPLVYQGPRPRLLWVARTPNRKTGDIPTAYVGHTKSETHATCQGCALYGSTCYAWSGFVGLSFNRLVERVKVTPERYTLDHALENRHKHAKAVRVGALGDPGRADPGEVLEVAQEARKHGLAVLAYSHFWRERDTQHLREIAMASCEDDRGADDALALGWRPAMILPWTHLKDSGPTFTTAGGAKGVVCPAQTKEGVTCNTCRMCTPEHPVWKAGKIQVIGFLDHSRRALREADRAVRGQLPIFRELPDVRPVFAVPQVHYRAVMHPSIVVKPRALEKLRSVPNRSWWDDEERPEASACDDPACEGDCPACEEIRLSVEALRAKHEADRGPRGARSLAVATKKRHVRGSGARGRR